MEKFGVSEDNVPSTKSAAESKEHSVVKCPICSAITNQHGQVFLCPTHGSKPFERDVPKK